MCVPISRCMFEGHSQERESPLKAVLIRKGFLEEGDGAPGGALAAKEFHRPSLGQSSPGRSLLALTGYGLPRTEETTFYAVDSFSFHQAPTRSGLFSPNHSNNQPLLSIYYVSGTVLNALHGLGLFHCQSDSLKKVLLFLLPFPSNR